MEAIIYNKQTGEVRMVLQASSAAAVAHYADSVNGIVMAADGTVNNADESWVENGTVKPATAVNLTVSTKVANLSEQVTVSGIPNPCWVYNSATDAVVKVTTGTYTFTSPTEQSIAIRLQGKYFGEVVVRFSSLVPAKTKAKLAVDAAAEEARLRVVTPGSGQAMTYLRKADAAAAFLAGETLSDSQTQRLEDEAARLNVTVAQAAETLSQTANAWEMLDAAIDNIRLTAKQNIDAAATGAAIDAVLKSLSWPV